MATTYESISSKSLSYSNRIWVFIKKNASILLIYGLIIIIAGTAAMTTEYFRTPTNIINIFRQSIILGLIAIGQSIVVLTGGLDMSVPMIARIVALVVATIFSLTNSDPRMIFPLIFLGITIGISLGGINGLLITKTHANPFIITFGMANILRGVNLAIATTPIRGIPDAYLKIYDAKIGIIPINVIVMALIWVAAYLFTTRTRTGRDIYAVGGSERIARLSTIRINRTLIITYMFSAFFAALAGLFLLSRTGVGDPSTAEGMDFQSVVAVALGGISLYGGKGSIIGTLGGVLLLVMLSNVFNMMQINIFYQQLLLGFIVLLAVAIYKTPRSA